MDDRTQTDGLLGTALHAARKHGLDARLVKARNQTGTMPDAWIEIRRGKDRLLFAVDVKRSVTAATLGSVVHHLTRLGEQALLVTDYITPPMAERLRGQRVAFLDASGNAYLDRTPLFVWVKGQKPAARSVAPEVGRAFQPTGLKVLFALLCNPEAVNFPYRQIAAMVNVAHGTVGWVIADLAQLGYLRESGGTRHTRRLFERARILPRWTEAYARVLRPRILIGRYYVPTIESWGDWQLAEHGAMWGGEPAASLLTGHLRPGELTIYADKLPGKLAGHQKFLQNPRPGHTGVVEIRRRFWTFPGHPRHGQAVPPLLVYADLLAVGDQRCIETADLVYEAHIVRLLSEA
jgi:hypothetical protein